MNINHVKIKKISTMKFFVFAICTVAFYFLKLPLPALILVIAETVIIIKKANYSLLSVFSFLVNYCLFMEYFAYKDIGVYGLLDLGYVNVYYFEMYLCCAIFSLLILLFVDTTKILEREKNIYKINFHVSSTATKIYCFIAVVITLMIFPSLPGSFDLSNRFFGGIISFSGWSCLPFFFIAVGILGRKSKKIVFPCTFFVTVWYLLHGERVEAIGLLVFMMIWLFNTRKMSLLNKVTIVFIVGIAAIVVLTLIGLIRGGGAVSTSQLVQNILVQTTACDVTNVFNCAVDLYKNGNGYHGITYLSYITNCIPYLEDPYSFSRMISAGYRSAGGGHFLAEPYANGGIYLAAVISFLCIMFVFHLVRKNSTYRTLIYIELFLSIFRISWYGLNYPIVTIIYVVPFAMLINKIFTRDESHILRFFNYDKVGSNI